MNQITTIDMEYSPRVKGFRFTPYQLNMLGEFISRYVCEVMSTRAHPISNAKDIRFTPVAYPEGYLGGRILIKIRTPGYPDRKAKVEGAKYVLKDNIITLFKSEEVSIDLSAEDRLISVDYEDPDGFCV